MKKKNALKRLSVSTVNKHQRKAPCIPNCVSMSSQMSTVKEETKAITVLTSKEEIEQIKQKIKKRYERHDDVPEKKRSQPVLTVNIKSDMPTVETALERLMDAIREARSYAVKVIKLIHGYGSTGKGGKICAESRKKLEALKKAHQIKDYIPGEKFTIYNPIVRQFMDLIPTLKAERDLENYNYGISFIIL